MLAIAKAESGLKTDSQGWNCWYQKADKSLLTPAQAAEIPRNKRISTACKPTHRESAWSVDCGVYQINVIGKLDCPKELFDVETNISAAQGKFQRQGYGAWSVYKNGSYKKHLKA